MPRLLIALTAVAALAAGCGGGGQNAPVVPGTNPAKDSTRPATSGHRILFYSKSYIKEHPELAHPGLHELALRRLTASGSGQLLYKGGPIQKYPKIYLIFWGWNSANDSTHDPSGMAQYLVNYVNALGGSNLANVATQYYENARGNITNPTGQNAGVWYDNTSTPPSTYAESDIQGEANRAVSHFGYSADANYFVVTPHNYTTSGFGTQFCAFHNAMSGGGGPIAYTDMPYVADAGASCGQGSLNSPGTLDGASIVGGHEMQETITDPGAGNGWIDATGAENGDKCAWTGDANVTMYGGAVFPNQPEWSNAISGCAYSYGTTPTPSPKPTNTPTPAPTPTPSGSCAGQLLLNPGFESGTANWATTSGVINTDGVYAHTGAGYAWLNGYGTTHTDTVSQSVAIKAGCRATMTYWLRIDTAETGTTAYDKLTLSINGIAKQSYSNVNAGAYLQRTLDLSAYAGSTVAIKWTGTEDASLATSFFIDDTAVTLH
ncbi:MAG: immune inhibitor A [Candidatus Eremiobacteraeota bacterium]|nr:immune inhibitor A [Candidatus Eremiobacteraeota bacterium]